MKEVDPTPTLSTDLSGPRALSKEFYTVYSLEDTNQARLYKRLAKFVKDEVGNNGLVESVAPSGYVEDDVYHYVLLVTVAL